MPEMNGIDFIRALRGHDKMKDKPILMVITNAAKDDIVEALRAGVNNYIVKPFTPETFRERSTRRYRGDRPRRTAEAKMVPHTEMILQLVDSTDGSSRPMVFKKLEHVMPIEGNAGPGLVEIARKVLG
jgi:DNA-binding response OmpR family regulator